MMKNELWPVFSLLCMHCRKNDHVMLTQLLSLRMRKGAEGADNSF